NIDFNALGGADTITVNDMTGTDVSQVALDLSGVPGSGVGDGATDTININGTNADDVINITENNGVVTVSGLAETVTISGFDSAIDRIVINGLGGNDGISPKHAGGPWGECCAPRQWRRRPCNPARRSCQPHTDR